MSLGQLKKWHVCMLGGVTVRCGEYEVGLFPYQKLVDLLCYLALRPGQPYTRESLEELFWPDSQATDPHGNTTKAISVLRKMFNVEGLPQNIFDETSQDVRLKPELLQTDVQLFKSNLSAAKEKSGADKIRYLEQALATYTGSLSPNSTHDEIVSCRIGLEVDFAKASIILAKLYLSDSRPKDALTVAKRASIATYDETAIDFVARLFDKAPRSSQAVTWCLSTLGALRRLGRNPPRSVIDLATKLNVKLTRSVDTSVQTPQWVTRSQKSLARVPPLLPPCRGRDADVDAIEKILNISASSPDELTPERIRLLTVVGPGGIGKTRLAQLIATRQESAGHWAVAYVGLEEVSEAPLIFEAIAEQVGLSTTHPRTDQRIIRALGQRPTFLVIDNLEHLAENGEQLVYRLLKDLPKLICLVTSRHSINLSDQLPDEQVYRLGPLYSSDVNSPAVQLILDILAAHEVNGKCVKPTHLELEMIQSICELVEGIPTALRLAATWCCSFGIEKTLTLLQQDRKKLKSLTRTKPSRHQDLWSILKWTFDLLNEWDRNCLTDLSVFHGPFDLDAAEHVCSLGDATLVRVASLSGWGLLQPHLMGTINLYSVPELTREPLLAKLNAEQTSRLEYLCHRHLIYYCELVRASWGIPNLVIRLHSQHKNLIEALRRSVSNSALFELGSTLVLDLNEYWQHHGLYADGQYWTTKFVNANKQYLLLSNAQLAWLLHDGGTHAMFRCDYRTAALMFRSALPLFEQVPHLPGQAAVLSRMALLARKQSCNHRALIMFRQSLQIYEELYTTQSNTDYKREFLLQIGQAKNNLGTVEESLGQFDVAEFHYREALQIMDGPNGFPLEVSKSINNIGNVLFARRQYHDAIRCYERAYELSEKNQSATNRATAAHNLGRAALALGDFGVAYRYFVEALDVRESIEDWALASYSQQYLGRVAYCMKEIELSWYHAKRSMNTAVERTYPESQVMALYLLGCLYSECEQFTIATRLWGAAQALGRISSLNLIVTTVELRLYRSRVKATRNALGVDYSNALRDGRECVQNTDGDLKSVDWQTWCQSRT